MLSPFLAGQWDACNVWAQWSPLSGATYLFEWRWRNPNGEWSIWQSVSREGGLRRAWLSFPTWRAGAEIQARVAVAEEVPCWELAQEVTFRKSRVRFRGTSERGEFVLPKGAEIMAIVDGAACGYVLAGDLVVPAGGEAEVDAEALGASGFMQLDHPAHFTIQPSLGVTIANLGPSENDVEPTGRDCTTVKAAPATPPRLAFRRRANVR